MGAILVKTQGQQDFRIELGAVAGACEDLRGSEQGGAYAFRFLGGLEAARALVLSHLRQ